MLFAKRTPTVKAMATGGNCFASDEASTTRSSPVTIWYREFEETPRKTPVQRRMSYYTIRSYTGPDIISTLQTKYSIDL